MSLDLTKTATQVDGMAVDLKARQNEREQRLGRALEAIESFPVDDYERMREEMGDSRNWALPAVPAAPDSRRAPAALPPDFCVAAVDGSHIDVDRHLPVRCFLINTGVSVLTYGSDSHADLFNRPRLYARDDELVIRDATTYREQAIEGGVLGAKRTVEEIRALVEVVGDLPKSTPTLALLDGSLVMLGLVGQLYGEFVLRELIEEGYVGALEELRRMAKDRPLAVASYVSLPRSAHVAAALRLMACSYGTTESESRCGPPGPSRQPCERCVGGVLDREIFAEVLEPGERTTTFATAPPPALAGYYGGHGVSFFYVNVGEEIGRVEVPSWVAADEGLLGLAHALIVDQCRRGRGYPVGLMEAHEQAVVSGADRRYFVQLVEQALHTEGMPVYTSEKARSKQLRWL